MNRDEKERKPKPMDDENLSVMVGVLLPVAGVLLMVALAAAAAVSADWIATFCKYLWNGLKP